MRKDCSIILQFSLSKTFKECTISIINKAKDWSDIYHYFGKNRLIKEFNEAFNKVKIPDMDSDLPF